ncbi:lycopene cyclase family protein [Amycolatopsis jiangsuensis]|uniref:Lycopene beta-cyclase n=1 Tax=Amycolatopsis jiangsuensis TaxID=1181879 RepID=A0A840ITS8_9PSEU|nr:lycopene cyclase family protein [Amycolatopsis jiangsuensis]MBB4684558.1 lycopene beta-cyclase [Amycolatopsis jiangsuensis]
MTDVLVAGGGPAGWALAGACARLGLATVLADPAPHRRWRATYGVWSDDVPGLPTTAIAAAPATTLAYGTRAHRVDRNYLVLANDGLRDWLVGPQVEVVTGRVTTAEHGPHGSTVHLADGRRLPTAVVVDATGAARTLSGGRPRGPRTEQTAYGVVLPAESAERLVPGAADTAVFMDWREPGVPGEHATSGRHGDTTPVDRLRSPGADATFCYFLPLGDGSVLVEETSLARRPGLSGGELAARLRGRLAAAGVRAEGRIERVRIPLDLPVAGRGWGQRQVVPFGVAAGFVHPATGYSLATSLRLAPVVAGALAGGLEAGPADAVRTAHRALWTVEARAVHALRRHGLRALLGMSPDQLTGFFDLFFALPATAQRAFTSGRADVAGTAAAMATLFRTAPPGLRRRLLGGLLRSR